MAQVIITFKIMPETPDVDLDAIQKLAEEKIDAFVGEEAEKRIEIEPIAFGLKALKITFVSDESKGGTEDIEAAIADFDGVQSCEVVDVRRALG